MQAVLGHIPEGLLRTSSTNRLALDLDGTLAGSIEKAFDLYNEDNGTNFSYQDYDIYGITGSKFQAKSGATFEVMYSYMRKAWMKHWRDIKPNANRSTLLNIADKIPVDIVTAMDENLSRIARRWLAEFYPGFEPKIVHVVHAPEKITLGYPAYIDDNPYLQDLILNPDVSKGAHPRAKLYLVTTPYTVNSAKEVKERVLLVRDVNDALGRILESKPFRLSNDFTTLMSKTQLKSY